MNERENQSEDERIIETLREAYRPHPLTPARRATILAGALARAERPRFGALSRPAWASLAAAAALGAVAIAILRTPAQHAPATSSGRVDEATIAVEEESLFSTMDPSIGLDEQDLPEDYQALLADFLRGPA